MRSVCVVALLVLAALVFVAAGDNGNNSVMLQRQFDEWAQQHGKVYETQQERDMRFRNFMASLARIERLNSERRGENDAVFGLNKFSDMSEEEFKNTMLMTPFEPSVKGDNVLKPTVAANDLPDVVNWYEKEVVTPVKNQGQCGSCWAFSTVEAIESAWILAGKGTVYDTNLAPQQIVDCDTVDDGCNGGNPPTAYQYVISAGGLESNESYPYEAVDGKCHFQKSEVVASISSWQYATNDFRSESLLQQNLVSWGPLSICVDAARWQDYVSGVMNWYQCDIIPLLDHCVQLVGFNQSAPTPYYMVRNSWGFDWGIEGYIWLEMNKDTCGITHETTWPTI